ncbi:TetR family transcriptional regulator [Motilibacter rhizosphaerae]|uniref:TetR family transcriptional regulator n=1 Tax=Motilibacter rhizosphaerae TaxID=598652 RepID=A0A4Q7NVC2_9ACTN|nr:TetR/AcrR family transcriptional regulator [Motilibacter rhizosphaerae]RZS91074.1 TetR family transcriptional regulator [Motilibacter rhizosphaerae]
MTTAPSAERPLRKDAAENRRRVLSAARELLGRHGLDVSMDAIAAEAGVGTGTLYRRFPSKEALVDALVADIAESVRDAAERALARGDGTGLEAFLREVAASCASWRGFLARLWDAHRSPAQSAEVRALVDRLLAQARQHGRVGPGVELRDVLLLLWALRGVIETTEDEAPGSWERHLELHLVGLRVGLPPGEHRSGGAVGAAG